MQNANICGIADQHPCLVSITTKGSSKWKDEKQKHVCGSRRSCLNRKCHGCHKIFVHRYSQHYCKASVFISRNGTSVHLHPPLATTTDTTPSSPSAAPSTPPSRILGLIRSRRCNQHMGTRICVKERIGPQLPVFRGLEPNRNSAGWVPLTSPCFLHFPLTRLHCLLP